MLMHFCWTQQRLDGLAAVWHAEPREHALTAPPRWSPFRYATQKEEPRKGLFSMWSMRGRRMGVTVQGHYSHWFTLVLTLPRCIISDRLLDHEVHAKTLFRLVRQERISISGSVRRSVNRSVGPSVSPLCKIRVSRQQSAGLTKMRSYTESNDRRTCFESFFCYSVVSSVC